MNSTDITEVRAWEALDSRGRPTVGCRITLHGGGTGRVVVPSGASTGGYEAQELRDGGTRYRGFGVSAAVANVNTLLADAVAGMSADDQASVDGTLAGLDEDHALGHVGSNAVLAVSLATLLAAADARRQPLWKMLGGPEPLLPMPMVNIFSGGAHAGRAIDLQDILAVPLGASTVAQAIEWVSRVRHQADLALVAAGYTTNCVADEGGLAAPLAVNEDALRLVTNAISATGLHPGKDVWIAVDIAANELWTDGQYTLKTERLQLTAEEWLSTLCEWCDRYPICSLEDVLHEDDWANWTAATPRLGEGRQLLGDDLFATNAERLSHGVRSRAANAVLVKPNQAGTVTRTADVVKIARAAGYATVVSARSGDTEDSWLADLAIGWRAGQIKVGSTTRSERTAKWNRLLEIEATEHDTHFATNALRL